MGKLLIHRPLGQFRDESRLSQREQRSRELNRAQTENAALAQQHAPSVTDEQIDACLASLTPPRAAKLNKLTSRALRAQGRYGVREESAGFFRAKRALVANLIRGEVDIDEIEMEEGKKGK